MNTVLINGDDSFFSFLRSSLFYKRCVFIYVCSVSLIECAGSVGTFLASRVMYIFVCVSFRCVEWRAGTSLFRRFGGVDGGTVRIFLSLRLCSGGYGTVEMGKKVVRFFVCFLQFAVTSLGGWMSAVGIFVLYFILLVVLRYCLVVFFFLY